MHRCKGRAYQAFIKKSISDQSMIIALECFKIKARKGQRINLGKNEGQYPPKYEHQHQPQAAPDHQIPQGEETVLGGWEEEYSL